jgi:hypothetical protein
VSLIIILMVPPYRASSGAAGAAVPAGLSDAAAWVGAADVAGDSVGPPPHAHSARVIARIINKHSALFIDFALLNIVSGQIVMLGLHL